MCLWVRKVIIYRRQLPVMENMVNIINIDQTGDNAFLGYKRPFDADAEIISLYLLGVWLRANMQDPQAIPCCCWGKSEGYLRRCNPENT